MGRPRASRLSAGRAARSNGHAVRLRRDIACGRRLAAVGAVALATRDERPMSAAELSLVAVFGLVIGSFLNVCIGRLPAGESVVSPGSRCPSYRVAIAWYDNIPVVSYLVLGGRCRACGARISPRYLAIEIITAVLFVLQALAIPF